VCQYRGGGECRRDSALADGLSVDQYQEIGLGDSVMASSFGPYSWHISSVEELMALAEAQERRAAARYDQLAARMDRFGSPETATLFRQLAAMEREHVEALSDWAGPTAPHGRLPDGLGEGTAADSDEVPASLTAYRALAIAVRNEERAFSLLTYVAAHAEKTNVRVRAEALALEELRHVALLHAQRRKAFHAKRHDESNRERDIAAALQSIASLRAVAGKLLSLSLGIHRAIALELRNAGDQDAADLLFRLVAVHEAEARKLGVQDPGGLEAETAGGERVPTPSILIARALRPVEEMVDVCLAASERSRDEEVVREAQRLAALAITWLAELRADLEVGA
jgi:rubrerythrin